MSRTTLKKRAQQEAIAPTDDYLNLIQKFPLRRIDSEARYDRAIEVFTELVRRADTPGLTAGESDYANVLGDLIGAYEEKHYPRKNVTPLELLKYLMEQHSMNTTQLGELLGSGRGQASLILNGKRELSKANIRTLAERFKVSAAAFL